MSGLPSMKGRWVIRTRHYEFTPEWRITLIVISAVVLFTSLGQWQLHRRAEKQRLLDAQEVLSAKPPIPFRRAEESSLTEHTLIIEGRYLPTRQFLLDNRVHRGQVGYDVYSAFRLKDGRDLLVQRGWIAAKARRTLLPSVNLDSTPRRLLVQAYRRDRLLPEFGQTATADRWPVRIQNPDTDRMAELAGLNLATRLEMRLLPGQLSALVVVSPSEGLQPEKHLGYALQWFTFAGLTLFLWLKLNTRSRH